VSRIETARLSQTLRAQTFAGPARATQTPKLVEFAVPCAVTVIVPAYNSASTLPKAVESALRQDLADIELLIVNDGSRDGTVRVARQLAESDPRVRLISLLENRGKPHAMNVGTDNASGRWTAVLDADDWYASGRLSRLMGIAEREQVDLIADNQFLYDEGAERVVRTAFESERGDGILDKAGFVAGSDPYAEFDYGMLKPLVRTEFIRKHSLRYREQARLSEDFLFLVEFFAAGGTAFLVSEPLYYWRQAFGSLSRQWTRTAGGSWRYNFQSAESATRTLMQSLESRGEPELLTLLQRRMRAFQRLHLMQEINRMRVSGAAPTQLAREILTHPTVWPLVMQRGVRRIKRHLPHLAAQRA
jgi:succinoglycan biosynthesis protein ExoO